MVVHSSAPRFGDLLTQSASWLIVGCAVWGALIVVATVIEVGSRGRLQATTWVGCPPRLRRVLVAALGVTMTATPGIAFAQVRPAWPHATSGEAGGLAVPERAVGPAHTDSRLLVVRPGDTLWHLCERRLPASVDAEEVAAAVEHVYRHNRALIGPDPDLIRPGQRLAIPRVHHEARPHHEQERP